jgi:arsenate reductase
MPSFGFTPFQIANAMNSSFLFSNLTLLICMVIAPATTRLSPKVESYVKDRQAEISQIPEERRTELLKISEYIVSCQAGKRPARLLFVCTHNSRRSHLAQLWAQIAATHFGIPGLETFSGGTETTAMNIRTVAALQRAGVTITTTDNASSNPKYSVVFSQDEASYICFSKILTEKPNPTDKFAAIMTCSSADQSCPNVKGCELRLSLPYEDPKVADGTPHEAAAYDEKSKEIAREMLFVMSRVARR